MTDSAARAPAAEVVVLVPTYNESESLPGIVGRVRSAVPEAAVLVIDDASPDGTGELAEELAAADPLVSVLHRAGKEGLGRAYRAGFALALERGHRLIVEMDADGSHPPETLPALLAAARAGADLVIGSRWTPGGRTVAWSRRRTWLSRTANRYAAWMLRIPVADSTAGYRVYRAEALRALDLSEVRAHGYYFQVDMTARVLEQGGRVEEVPIEFVERRAGASKMTFGIIVEAMLAVTALGIRRRFRRSP